MQSWLDITLRWMDQSGPSRGEYKPDDDDDEGGGTGDDEDKGGDTDDSGRR